MTVFIISGGSMDYDFARDFIAKKSHDTYTIACDKGFEHCLKLGITPDVTIGDFDSISKEGLEAISELCPEVIKLNPIKDDTDTEAALGIAIEHTEDTDDIYILGATGTRLDHVLGNINLLGLGLKQKRRVALVDSHNLIRMISGGDRLSMSKPDSFGRYVSFFPYDGKAYGVTLKGFKYPLSEATLEGFNTLTVSNEIVDGVAHVTLDKGYLIVCESRD
ncbi:MAG: thiamine diphosphokinase [Pseudobutyrivibrio sp.]|nr:thiamine diphosphokinase [Pseudobutyrivibrio sp.]